MGTVPTGTAAASMIRCRTASDLPAGRQVHHRVGPVADGQQQFLQLARRIAGDGRLADVGVDLRPRGDADADRLEPLLPGGPCWPG